MLLTWFSAIAFLTGTSIVECGLHRLVDGVHLGTMLRLPNEILIYALGMLHYVDEEWRPHGDKDDLLSTRLVCRRLAHLGASLAFRHVTVIPDQKGYTMLRALSLSDHRLKVHMMNYNFEDFRDDDLSADEFDAYLRENARGHQSRWATTLETYEEYRAAQQYQTAMQDSHLDVAHLTSAFALLENIQSIHISQEFTERSGPWCGEEGILEGYLDFLDLPTSNRVLSTIVAALIATGRKLKSLTLMSVDELGFYPLTGLIEELNFSNPTLHREAFSHLKVLTILLPHDGEDADVDEEDEERYIDLKGLSVFITTLPALEELVFPGDAWRPTRFLQSFLRRLQVRRLLSIDIRGAAFAEPSMLIDFLMRHSDSLLRVKLHDLILHQGSWKDVFPQIRSNLSIQSSDLSGNFYTAYPGEPGSVEVGDGLQYHYVPVLRSRSIEDYIERRTDLDPFDLVQTYSHEYPRHTSSGDFNLCFNAICPHYYTPETAATKIMDKGKEVTSNGAIYNVTRHDIFLLSLVYRRQNRTQEANILWNVSAQNLGGQALRDITYCGGVLQLRDVF